MRDSDRTTAHVCASRRPRRQMSARYVIHKNLHDGRGVLVRGLGHDQPLGGVACARACRSPTAPLSRKRARPTPCLPKHMSLDRAQPFSPRPSRATPPLHAYPRASSPHPHIGRHLHASPRWYPSFFLTTTFRRHRGALLHAHLSCASPPVCRSSIDLPPARSLCTNIRRSTCRLRPILAARHAPPISSARPHGGN